MSMDESQRAQVTNAAATARANGQIAEAEELERFLKDNTPATQTQNKSAAPDVAAPNESYLSSGIVGSGAGVLGGGTALETMVNKAAPYNPDAVKPPVGNKTFANPADFGAKVEANLNRPSVTVQGISEPELASRKIPGASGASNYARVMPGEVMPDKMADLAEDMTKSSPKGAQRLNAINEQNVARQKAIVGDTFDLHGRGSEQLAIPKSEIEHKLAEAQKLSEEKAAAKEAAKNKLAKEAGEHATKTRAERQLKAEGLKSKPAAKLAKNYAELKKLVEVPEKYLTKAGELMRAGTGSFTTNAALRGATGFGAGMGADEAVTRWNKGQKIRGVVSGLGAVGDLAAMSRHPAAMGVGTAVGLAAPLVVNPALDKLAEAYPEMANKIGLAKGGRVKKYTIHTLPNGLSKEQFMHLAKGGYIEF